MDLQINHTHTTLNNRNKYGNKGNQEVRKKRNNYKSLKRLSQKYKIWGS